MKETGMRRAMHRDICRAPAGALQISQGTVFLLKIWHNNQIFSPKYLEVKWQCIGPAFPVLQQQLHL